LTGAVWLTGRRRSPHLPHVGASLEISSDRDDPTDSVRASAPINRLKSGRRCGHFLYDGINQLAPHWPRGIPRPNDGHTTPQRRKRTGW
jgi:hypothetical protein